MGVQRQGRTCVITLDRPQRRNAVDRVTAQALSDAFEAFDACQDEDVAVLTGAGGTFCAGADLQAIAAGDPNRLQAEGDGPMGPSRLRLRKPVIAAIEGYAVAGGLELALWCDLRVAASNATLGVFCRRFGVPLIDGGTVRLPRIVGLGRALDMVLTGRAVGADEALNMGLVSRVVAPGAALSAALVMAEELQRFPQACLRLDRASVYHAFGGDADALLQAEFQRGLPALEQEGLAGAVRFRAGEGRGGG